MQPAKNIASPRPTSKRISATRSARKITQTAPAAPIPSAIAIRGVSRWRRRIQPKPAESSGVSVKTAAVETAGAVFSPSNIRTK